MAGRIIRTKLRKKNSSGYSSIVVVGDDENNEVNTVDVSLSNIEGKPTPSPIDMTLPFKVKKSNGNKRYVFKDLTFSEDAVNYSYLMTAIMKDVNNNPVGDPFVSEVTVEDNGEPKLRTPRIRQRDATNFQLKVVVVADSDDEIARVDVDIIDLIGNPAQPESISMSTPIVTGDKKVFKINTLTFDDPAAAADQPYELVVRLYDAANNEVGADAFEIYVDGLEA